MVLQTVIGLCVFLAYGTTGSVARHLGAGDLRGRAAQGVDGLWLAVGIGIVVTVVGVLLDDPLVQPLRRRRTRSPTRPRPTCGSPSSAPCRSWSCSRRPGCCAGSRTPARPLVVAVVGNALNIVLNLVLVHPVGLGIAGSALGSVLAQVASAAVFVAVVVRAARRQGAPLRPDLPGIRAPAVRASRS